MWEMGSPGKCMINYRKSLEYSREKKLSILRRLLIQKKDVIFTAVLLQFYAGVTSLILVEVIAA